MEILIAILFLILLALAAWVATLTTRLGRAEAILKAEEGPAEEALRPLASRIHELEAERDNTLRRLAVIRYDAYGDTTGSMSFSAAFLSNRGDGMIITSLNGRSDSRTYSKTIASGSSDQPLSKEEQEAVAKAMRR